MAASGIPPHTRQNAAARTRLRGFLRRADTRAAVLAAVIGGGVVLGGGRPTTAAESSPGLRPQTPLHETIDAIVAEAAVGPLAARCSDADFVRRVHLDLVGVIPSPDTVRAFLADAAVDKRSRLIDTLLADDGFARHMMFVLDAMFLERAAPPGDLATSWPDYLFNSVADDTPLDAVVRDLLVHDGRDPAARPAAAFLLAREAEPVQLTRAIGRLMFGRDLQCAQCHDHPLDDDIRQAEHQGLQAFLARTSLFTASDNTLFVSEKADGEIDYRSVFTQEGEQGVWPRLPGGLPLVDEPRPEPAAAYAAPPTNSGPTVPTFSRRAALAAALADDEGFRRNLANRIWALCFGRGLVHPLDGLGRGNPPTHPRLLAVLADALRDEGFRLRPLVGAIVRSDTYQRSIEPPRPDDVDPAAMAAILEELATARTVVAADHAAREQTATEAERRRQATAAAAHAVHRERLERITARDTASQAAAAATAAVETAAVDLARARGAAAALATAAGHLAAAASVTGADDSIRALAEDLSGRAAAKAATVDAAAPALAEREAAAAAAAATLATTREGVAAATARLEVEALLAIEREAVAARRAAIDADHALRRLEERMQLARDLAAHVTLRTADPAAAAREWESIVDRWTSAGQVAAVRPLSPEQLALSVAQATGGLAARQAAAAAAIDEAPPEQVVQADDASRRSIRARHVEMRMVKDASGMLRAAAAIFADPLSEGFQASVGQALYFGNAPDVQRQFAPTGTNLTATLGSLDDPDMVAVEAFVAVLSRSPTDAERAEVATFLADRGADRADALAELVWALVSSSEFRFNH
jgi:hypothetical protein